MTNRSKNKVVKSVSFNVINEEDVKMLDYIGDENFSGYVKNLILGDIRKRESEVKIIQRSQTGGIKIFIGK
jgi:hypothetical protein